MTEPDFEAAKLRVYEEFGIWKPGEKCDKCTTRAFFDSGCSRPKMGHDWNIAHDIPPPELTDAVAWQVLIAAMPRMFFIEFRQWGERLENTEVNIIGSHQSSLDPKHALILALAGAGQGAHERS